MSHCPCFIHCCDKKQSDPKQPREGRAGTYSSRSQPTLRDVRAGTQVMTLETRTTGHGEACLVTCLPRSLYSLGTPVQKMIPPTVDRALLPQLGQSRKCLQTSPQTNLMKALTLLGLLRGDSKGYQDDS